MAESRSRSRGDLLACAGLLALSIVFFADVLFGPRTFYYGDLTAYFRGATVALRDIVLGGEFPSWNRYFSAGQPMAANPEFSVFYPPRYLVLLPGFEVGWKLHLWIHLPIAALGMYALLRSMSLRRVSSAFGAVAFAFSGFFLSYFSIPPFLFTLSWLPATLLFARKFVKSGRRFWFAAAASSLGLQLLAGEPTTVLQTCLLIGAHAIYEGSSSSGDARRVSRNVLLAFLTVAGAVLLAAMQVLPMLDHARETVRARGLTFEQIRWWSMPPVRILELLFPDLMGPLGDNQRWYWGRALYTHWTGPYFPRIYVGLLPVVLALSGIIARVRGWSLYLVVTASSLLLSAGDHTPLLSWLHAGGLFTGFRYPEKFILMAAVATVIYGAAVFDSLLNRDQRALRASLVVALTVAGLSVALYAVSHSDLYDRMWRELWMLPPGAIGTEAIRLSSEGWGFAATRSMAALLVVWLLLKRPRPVWRIAAIAVLAVDLLPLNYSVARRIDQGFFDAPAAARLLQKQPGSFRLFHEADFLEQLQDPAAPGYRVAGHLRYLQMMNGMYGRLPAAFGFESVLENDYDLSNVRATTSFSSAFMSAWQANDRATVDAMLRMSNVRFKLVPSPGISEPVAIVPIGELPRYYIADAVVPIRSGADFVEGVRSWRGSNRVAFIGQRAPAIGGGRVLNFKESATTGVVEVATDGPAFLVASVTWDRNWTATIDGRETSILRTNLGYQGVFLPPGRHRVQFRYRDPLIAAGAAISAATLLVLVLLCARDAQAFASSSTARSTASGVGTPASR